MASIKALSGLKDDLPIRNILTTPPDIVPARRQLAEMHEVALTTASLLHYHRIGAERQWCACENPSSRAVSQRISWSPSYLAADNGKGRRPHTLEIEYADGIAIHC
jgi:hypothetical protein